MKRFGFSDLPRGAIVGEANIIDVISYKNNEDFLKDAKKHCVTSLEDNKRRYGFVLEGVQRVKPIPSKGALNFFTPSIRAWEERELLRER
jgi:hypothetical protein